MEYDITSDGFAVLQPERMKRFKKSDLESGMVVVERSGEKGLVIMSPIPIIMFRNNSTQCLKYYSDDLEYMLSDRRFDKRSLQDYSSSDIDVVMIPKTTNSLKYKNWNHFHILWERNPVKEVTMEEVAKKFNTSVENIKII